LVVTGGGLAIIASILGILLFILLEVVPLVRAARIEAAGSMPLDHSAKAILTDPYRALVASVSEDGAIRVRRLADGSAVVDGSLLPDATPVVEAGPAGAEAPAAAPRIVGVQSPTGSNAFAAATDDGRVLVRAVVWDVSFDAESGARAISASLGGIQQVALDPERRPLGVFAAQTAGADRLAAAAQLADGSLAVVTRSTTTNDFSGETATEESRLRLPVGRALASLLVDRDMTHLYAGTAGGDLLWWNLADGDGAPPHVASAGSAAVTALAFLIGERALVVGQASGALSVWFAVRGAGDEMSLARIRDFPAHRAAIVRIDPSERNRTFLAGDDGGGLGLYFSTSERTLWRGTTAVAGLDGAAAASVLAPKGDAALLAGAGRLAILGIDNPHPEVSWKSLFGRVHYEGYERPEFAWQSTGGTDDFESKISLTPLVVGTLKGTIYSLLLAIPLGILGAMFASQFLHPKLLDAIKPTVEIMAALPSVVLGFLAGLWLAPALERYFPALLLGFVLLPLLVWLGGLAWHAVPLRLRGRFPAGFEVFLYLAVLVAGCGVAAALAPGFERLAFGGSFQSWLLEATGLQYDQRNAVVVGLAMGFAVIPIIFAISEDAFSNVPRNLVSGSLALGANRWQTVTRVVLPTASPGIFSAIMIGFGRAIGETMIVLMATGNTPILAMNPFNGFRTLSANIAVEIPEAPHGGTLYRTLFLAALLLFGITFVLNTAAELVRQRLRRKYAQL
jgi:phosphate transport system permease protein